MLLLNLCVDIDYLGTSNKHFTSMGPIVLITL